MENACPVRGKCHKRKASAVVSHAEAGVSGPRAFSSAVAVARGVSELLVEAVGERCHTVASAMTGSVRIAGLTVVPIIISDPGRR